MSVMKSLPEDPEIFAEGCSDAGELVLMLKQAGRYDEFVANHPAAWDTPPSQPSSDCIGHLACLLARTVEDSIQARVGGLRKKDFARFAKRSRAAHREATR